MKKISPEYNKNLFFSFDENTEVEEINSQEILNILEKEKVCTILKRYQDDGNVIETYGITNGELYKEDMKVGEYFSKEDFKSKEIKAVVSNTFLGKKELEIREGEEIKKIEFKDYGISYEKEPKITIPLHIFKKFKNGIDFNDPTLTLIINGEKEDLDKAINSLNSYIKNNNKKFSLNVYDYMTYDIEAEWKALMRTTILIIFVTLISSVGIAFLWVEDFKKDYKKENIPILLGNEFEKTQKLGDTFKIKYFSEAVRAGDFDAKLKEDFLTFEVVGFLERNAIAISNGPIELFAQTLLYSDGIKVIPSVENFIGYDAMGESANAAIFLERGIGVKEDELVKILNEKLKKYNLYANLFSLSATTTVIESYERDVKSSLALGFLLLVISIIGTSCIMLGQLNKRKKEFGIKIAMGATLNEIAKEIFLEVLVMVIIASIISLILNIKIGVGLTLIGINLVFVAIISILIAIIPVKEIKKMNVVELVKGN